MPAKRSDADDKGSAKPAEAAAPRAKRRRSQPLKVANQIPQSRRKEIEKALEDSSGTPKRWSRKDGPKYHRFLRKRISPGTVRQIEFDLLEVDIGESWPIPITVVHGARPGPVVTILGALHGNELVGPLALTYLCGPNILGEDKAIDPAAMAGTLRIVPVVNLPGYRRQSRYMADGRDLNRSFPGKPDSNTTSRVAHRLWNKVISGSDHVIDLHTAAVGRTNMPQIRANLAHRASNRIARAFGIEAILDNEGPKGSLRRVANDSGIGAITYEGGGPNEADPESVQVAIYGVLNVLRSLKALPGYPSRPRFRILASGSVWIRSDQGGLLDVLTPAGSFVEKGETVATVTDPERPGDGYDVLAPTRGLLISTATHPFVNAGTPIGHLLPVTRGVKTLRKRLDPEGCLVTSGSDGDPPWREDEDVEDISVLGEWSGGSPDAEWGPNDDDVADDEAGEADPRWS
ncbi:succinylglutamate desuccinylase/aspartoacylase family protein [Candidatus Thalassarchaeum betae]|mgnify:FL=1|uniref:succinylglutamate desuccinylase/aspartoacylase family protein n=1 Tax=Candidatus Thalassarchaeum betae TaxID=2599289 RepID=UPI0030C6F704|nr:succinylglutamate desuccinylase/aspartoacylase family protein [Candidatus Thalassoarchaea betae]